MKKNEYILEYTPQVQEVFLGKIIADPSLYVRISNIMNPQNFDKSLREMAEFIVEYVSKYNNVPDNLLIKQVFDRDILENVDKVDEAWFFDEFEKFTRQRELERAILKSADMLEKGDFNVIEKLIKDAVQISLTKDLGTDYFEDPRARLMKIKENNGQVSTGWSTMDRLLYGGFNRGELQIFAGGSGSGKSLFMQNLAVNWSAANMNGVYISLELSEELCSKRMDSMIAGISQKDIFRQLDDVELRIGMAAKRSGNLQIKYLPAQSTINDVRAYIKELEVRKKYTVDFLCIDYLDLLMPVSAKVSPSDLFVKDKYVSEEIRNLAKELNVVLVTASQLNRSAVEEIEFDHSHISGGISKINTADNVFGIFTSRHMREKGQYQLQLMKTRSSAGVGQKIDLEFNVETMRITDPQTFGEDDSGTHVSQSNSILATLKATSRVQPATTEKEFPPTVTAKPKATDSVSVSIPASNLDARTTKVQSLLNSIKAK